MCAPRHGFGRQSHALTHQHIAVANSATRPRVLLRLVVQPDPVSVVVGVKPTGARISDRLDLLVVIRGANGGQVHTLLLAVCTSFIPRLTLCHFHVSADWRGGMNCRAHVARCERVKSCWRSAMVGVCERRTGTAAHLKAAGSCSRMSGSPVGQTHTTILLRAGTRYQRRVSGRWRLEGGGWVVRKHVRQRQQLTSSELH